MFFTRARESRDGDLPSRNGISGVGAILSDADMAEIRAVNPRRTPYREVHRTACRYGHPLTGAKGESLAYKRPDGRFECRLCRAKASRLWRARTKAVVLDLVAERID